MIKLKLPPKPAKLEENEKTLTDEFKADNKKPVWKKEFIIQPLLEMTSGKCAYSEVKVNSDGSYVEVEHFKHKNKYPEDVVKWGNLLPSCKTCNVSKGDWDVVAYPIVNPLVDTPSDHLYMQCCRFYKKDSKGENTITALNLNDYSHFVLPRFKIASDLCGRLEIAFDDIKEAMASVDIRRRTLKLNALVDILRRCLPTEEYSASVATYLLFDSPVYREMKSYLQVNGLWNDELSTIDSTLNDIALSK